MSPLLTKGTAIIENLTTGEKASADETAPDGHHLDGENVEWIVEDYTGGKTGEEVPLCDWGTVTFSHKNWRTHGGATGGTRGAAVIDMVTEGPNSKLRSHVTLPGPGPRIVSIKYVNPH